MWVITYSINDYNQEGDYFLTAFSEKPTLKQLEKIVGSLAEHVMKGGGRQSNEFLWYYLIQVKDGEIYKSEYS